MQIIMVSARGMNIFPSIPCRVNSGTSTIMMIMTENVTGRATSQTACTVIWRRSAGSRCSAKWRRIFSTITIEASTIMPTEKARPPRLIRLDVRPVQPITRKVARKVIGSEARTVRAVLNSATKRNNTRMTKIPPSSNAFSTVLMHACIRDVRS